MKVSPLSILAAASTATAQIRTITKPYLPTNKHLMKNAKPYNHNNRRLQENNNDLTIDGTYSITFSSCLDIKTYDDNLFSEDLIQYVQAGKVVSAKSYVLFHACQEDGGDCDDENDLYIVDLSTYLVTVVDSKSKVVENYCRACEEAEEMCFANYVAAAAGYDDGVAAYDDDGAAAAGDDAGRKLSTRRHITEVTCDQCEAYGCFKDKNADDHAEEDRTEERLAEWITKLAECDRFEDAKWNGLELYYGAICNANGDGIEFASFLDEECTMYARQASFSTYYNATYEEEEGVYVDYSSSAESYIAEALTSAMSCSKYEAPKEDDDGDDNVDEMAEVNEYCEKLFKDSAASVSECNATTADNDNQEYNYGGGYNFNWYSFDMTVENADDIDQVCTKVKELNGNYYHAYKAPSSSSGSRFHVNKSTANEWAELSSFEMSSIEIVLLTAAMLSFAICCCRRRFMQSKRSDLDTNLV